jgi:hypothetical protein
MRKECFYRIRTFLGRVEKSRQSIPYSTKQVLKTLFEVLGQGSGPWIANCPRPTDSDYVSQYNKIDLAIAMFNTSDGLRHALLAELTALHIEIPMKEEIESIFPDTAKREEAIDLVALIANQREMKDSLDASFDNRVPQVATSVSSTPPTATTLVFSTPIKDAPSNEKGKAFLTQILARFITKATDVLNDQIKEDERKKNSNGFQERDTKAYTRDGPVASRQDLQESKGTALKMFQMKKKDYGAIPIFRITRDERTWGTCFLELQKYVKLVTTIVEDSPLETAEIVEIAKMILSNFFKDDNRMTRTLTVTMTKVETSETFQGCLGRLMAEETRFDLEQEKDFCKQLWLEEHMKADTDRVLEALVDLQRRVEGYKYMALIIEISNRYKQERDRRRVVVDDSFIVKQIYADILPSSWLVADGIIDVPQDIQKWMEEITNRLYKINTFGSKTRRTGESPTKRQPKIRRTTVQDEDDYASNADDETNRLAHALLVRGPCSFFSSPRGCLKGDACDYFHGSGGGGAPHSSQGRQQNAQPPGGRSSHGNNWSQHQGQSGTWSRPRNSHNTGYGGGQGNGGKECWGFQKGSCKFGNRCRFSHGQQAQSGQGNQSGFTGSNQVPVNPQRTGPHFQQHPGNVNGYSNGATAPATPASPLNPAAAAASYQAHRDGQNQVLRAARMQAAAQIQLDGNGPLLPTPSGADH